MALHMLGSRGRIAAAFLLPAASVSGNRHIPVFRTPCGGEWRRHFPASFSLRRQKSARFSFARPFSRHADFFRRFSPQPALLRPAAADFGSIRPRLCRFAFFRALSSPPTKCDGAARAFSRGISPVFAGGVYGNRICGGVFRAFSTIGQPAQIATFFTPRPHFLRLRSVQASTISHDANSSAIPCFLRFFASFRAWRCGQSFGMMATPSIKDSKQSSVSGTFWRTPSICRKRSLSYV